MEKIYTPFNALDHEEEISRWFTGLMRDKYRAGQDEHGGKLWRKPMLKHMTEEVIDLVVYMQTHTQQQHQLTALLMRAKSLIETFPYEFTDGLAECEGVINRALNLLVEGNEEGKTEEERNP